MSFNMNPYHLVRSPAYDQLPHFSSSSDSKYFKEHPDVRSISFGELIDGKDKHSQALIDEALKFYPKILEKTGLQYKMGLQYYEGKGKVKHNEYKAYFWIKMAADKGNPKAQFKLGYWYVIGIIVEKSHQLAEEYLKNAASKNIHAALLLGNISNSNRLIVRSVSFRDTAGKDKYSQVWINEAMKIYPKYRNILENEKLQYLIGIRYMTGKGRVKQNEFKALFWIKMAADRGSAKAQFQLGYWYAMGILVEQSVELAKEFLKKAASKNVNAVHLLQALK